MCAEGLGSEDCIVAVTITYKLIYHNSKICHNITLKRPALRPSPEVLKSDRFGGDQRWPENSDTFS